MRQGNWQQHDQSKEKDHPFAVGLLVHSAEKPEGVGSWSDWQQRRCRPSEEICQRLREICAHPPETSAHISRRSHAIHLKDGDALRNEGACQEDREERESDSLQLFF